ncbi:Imm74 family immunity protein [Dyadobacter sp. 32]|uniref:Imm74 family immunity protein n=1 Tax=Dyadobacter sp. 32 TaxID=538966 RepID=UPI0011EF447A
MKIRCDIISRGEMIIYVDEKKIRVTGELTFSPSVFYANLNSIKYWDDSNGRVEIAEEEIQNIVSVVTDISKDGGTRILFD